MKRFMGLHQKEQLEGEIIEILPSIIVKDRISRGKRGPPVQSAYLPVDFSVAPRVPGSMELI
jgi:hypothetical protein